MSFVKTRTLNAGTLGNRLKFQTLHVAMLPFYQTKYSNCMAILSTLESTTLDETIRSASKWSITVKSPTITQRPVSQENAFKKSKNLSAFFRITIGSNNSFTLIENIFRFLR